MKAGKRLLEGNGAHRGPLTTVARFLAGSCGSCMDCDPEALGRRLIYEATGIRRFQLDGESILLILRQKVVVELTGSLLHVFKRSR